MTNNSSASLTDPFRRSWRANALRPASLTRRWKSAGVGRLPCTCIGSALARPSRTKRCSSSTVHPRRTNAGIVEPTPALASRRRAFHWFLFDTITRHHSSVRYGPLQLGSPRKRQQRLMGSRDGRASSSCFRCFLPRPRTAPAPAAATLQSAPPAHQRQTDDCPAPDEAANTGPCPTRPASSRPASRRWPRSRRPGRIGSTRSSTTEIGCRCAGKVRPSACSPGAAMTGASGVPHPPHGFARVDGGADAVMTGESGDEGVQRGAHSWVVGFLRWCSGCWSVRSSCHGGSGRTARWRAHTARLRRRRYARPDRFAGAVAQSSDPATAANHGAPSLSVRPRVHQTHLLSNAVEVRDLAD
jgi:hypothetical protein